LNGDCASENLQALGANDPATLADEAWESITATLRLTIERRFGDELKRP